ncbi:hypothetical protein [Frankia tisae]|uniref:hypothetical protein n=1 Tax=Frankia tisae TaxID=2950104 RepID=UPI0021C15C34|nr:hypothetical protein [Frankia tisae]
MGNGIGINRRHLFLLAGVGLVPAADLMSARHFSDHASAVIDNLYAEYPRRDLAATARTAGAHLRSLAAVGGQRMRAHVAQDVLMLQGRAGALRARALVDAGDTEAAWRVLGTAIARASRAGDRRTVAFGFATKSAADLADRRPADALRIAERGLHISGDDPRLYLAAARAHAARLDADAADADVRIAERLLDEQNAPMIGGPMPGVTSRLEWSRAAVDVYSRTGRSDRARDVLETTVADVPANLTEDTRQALGASYALVQARAEPDAGADILRRTLTASATMGRPARTVTARVDAFLAAVPDQRHPAVRDLVDLRRSLDV